MLEEQFEQLLRETIPIACCEECFQIERQTLLDGTHTFSKEFEQKMQLLLENHSHFSAAKEVSAKRRKLNFRYAFAAILLFLLSSITVFAQGPWKEMLGAIVNFNSEHYLFLESPKDTAVPTESVLYRPTYIPDGYVFAEESEETSSAEFTMTWYNDLNQILHYIQVTPDSEGFLLSLGKTEATAVVIGDQAGWAVDGEGDEKIVFYEKDDNIFVVTGVLSIEELTKILGSVK